MIKATAAAPPPLSEQARADEDSFRDEFVALLPSMRAFARSLCRNRAEADDLAQTAMMNAWRARRSYMAGTNLRAWLYTILRNQYISERRRAATWRTDTSIEDVVLPSPHNQEAAVEMSDVQAALMKLPEEQREALILVGAGGFAYHEAAAICGCAVGTIKSRVARARRALASILGEPRPGSADAASGEAADATETAMDDDHDEQATAQAAEADERM
jgi:RNA polymerase sigma-70 factor (ECF subfamily)